MYIQNNVMESNAMKSTVEQVSKLTASQYESIAKEVYERLLATDPQYATNVKLHIRDMRCGWKVGNGVFAKETIQQGEVLGVYSGKMHVMNHSTAREQMSHGDCLNRIDVSECIHIPSHLKKLIFMVDGGDHRNNPVVCMQHLPLPCASLSEESATQNVIFETEEIIILVDAKGLPIASVPVMIAKASEEIHEGDAVGWDYGPDYWRELGLYPMLFNKKGGELTAVEVKITSTIFQEKNHYGERRNILERYGFGFHPKDNKYMFKIYSSKSERDQENEHLKKMGLLMKEAETIKTGRLSLTCKIPDENHQPSIVCSKQ